MRCPDNISIGVSETVGANQFFKRNNLTEDTGAPVVVPFWVAHTKVHLAANAHIKVGCWASESSGPHYSLKLTGPVQAFQTVSRGASNTRVIT